MVLVVFLYSCVAKENMPPDHARKYGFKDAILHRALVDSAIDMTNQILRDSVDVRLISSWREPTQSQAKFVPVYLLQEYGLAKSDVVFVPDNERCIFINEKGMLEFLRSYTDELSGFSVNLSKFLAIILLHEVGHLHFGDTGSYTGVGDVTVSGLNRVDNFGKDAELRADLFAAEQIREAGNIGSNEFALGMYMRLTLSNIQSNVFRQRMFGDNFGSTTLRSPKVFWDKGYSHPNFELRLLIICYAVFQDTQTREALEDFLDRRNNPGNPILYFDMDSVLEK